VSWPLQTYVDPKVIQDILVSTRYASTGAPGVAVKAIKSVGGQLVLDFSISTHTGELFRLACGSLGYTAVADLGPQSLVLTFDSELKAYSALEPLDSVLVLEPLGTTTRVSDLNPNSVLATRAQTDPLLYAQGWLLKLDNDEVVPDSEDQALTFVSVVLRFAEVHAMVLGSNGLDLGWDIEATKVMPVTENINSVAVGEESVDSGVLELKSGYNTRIDNSQNRVTITAGSGLGLGRVPDPGTPQHYSLSGARPDSYGNVVLTSGDDCYSIKPVVTGSTAVFQLTSVCQACCSCEDYENVGKAVQHLLSAAVGSQGLLYTRLGYPEANPDASTLLYKYNELLKTYNNEVVPVYTNPVIKAYGALGASKTKAVVNIGFYNRAQIDLVLGQLSIAFESDGMTREVTQANYVLTPNNLSGILGLPSSHPFVFPLQLITVKKARHLTLILEITASGTSLPSTWTGTAVITVPVVGGEPLEYQAEFTI
jgi:hypothetical protein